MSAGAGRSDSRLPVRALGTRETFVDGRHRRQKAPGPTALALGEAKASGMRKVLRAGCGLAHRYKIGHRVGDYIGPKLQGDGLGVHQPRQQGELGTGCDEPAIFDLPGHAAAVAGNGDRLTEYPPGSARRIAASLGRLGPSEAQNNHGDLLRSAYECRRFNGWAAPGGSVRGAGCRDLLDAG